MSISRFPWLFNKLEREEKYARGEEKKHEKLQHHVAFVEIMIPGKYGPEDGRGALRRDYNGRRSEKIREALHDIPRSVSQGLEEKDPLPVEKERAFPRGFPHHREEEEK